MRAYKKHIVTLCVVWAVSAALFTVAHFFIVSPQLKVKAKLMKESANKQKLFEAAIDAAKEETQKKLADEVDSLRTKLYVYASDFEDSANMPLEISRVAAEKQVASFTVKKGEQTREAAQMNVKNLREDRIEISFVSDFRQFAAFLNALERHQPVVFVDRFRLIRGNEGPASHKADMDLTVFVTKRPEG
jgi:hypothetical protein